MALLLYPLLIFKFWYIEAPIGILQFYLYFNTYMTNLLSVDLIRRTFFKPMKEEYREGLVGFSIMMGVIFKTFLLGIDAIIFICIILMEFLLLFAFLAFPFVSVYLYFI